MVFLFIEVDLCMFFLVNLFFEFFGELLIWWGDLVDVIVFFVIVMSVVGELVCLVVLGIVGFCLEVCFG